MPHSNLPEDLSPLDEFMNHFETLQILKPCTLLWFQIHPKPIGSMVLVYMLTFGGYIDGIHVTIYSSTMDPMGIQTYHDLRRKIYHRATAVAAGAFLPFHWQLRCNRSGSERPTPLGSANRQRSMDRNLYDLVNHQIFNG